MGQIHLTMTIWHSTPRGSPMRGGQREEGGGGCRGHTLQVGTSTPPALMTFSMFFRASGTCSASSSLRLLMHSCVHTSTP